MNQKLIVSALVLLTAGCFGGYQPRGKTCPDIEALQPKATMLAIGDSVFAWRNQTCRTIPDVVGLELGRRIDHRAVNGAQITGGEFPITDQYESGDWQWVMVDGGGNDLNKECECGVDCDPVLDALISEDGNTGEVPTLVDRILADGAQVLLYGYFEVSPKADYGFDECIAEIDELRRRQSKIAESRPDVLFVDAREVVTVDGTPEAYAFDDVHPSDEGAELVGKWIAGKILEYEEAKATSLRPSAD